MMAMRKSAADGHFAISETGGQALLEAFREMAEWVDDNLGKLGHLAQEPQLGSSNGANTMKPFVQQVATDQQGFITMLREFRTSIGDAEKGVRDAMTNYQTIDQGSAQTF
ncbi:MAG: hypothetical protein GEV28_09180 [Actinophytocola sp.]|nr:hypothetical protein [Actinophytocola sp.]